MGNQARSSAADERQINADVREMEERDGLLSMAR
jgi:hypothetical protein